MDNHKQKIPPYKMNQPKINFDLSEYKKEGTPPELFTALAGEIKEKYNNYKHIYTSVVTSFRVLVCEFTSLSKRVHIT